MLDNVKKCGYDVPTPIQSYVLPSVFRNTDVIGIAQTGVPCLPVLDYADAYIV